jgi:acyl-CoA synthetase (NDP forming)
VATVDPQLIQRCLRCLIHSDEIDAVVIMYVPRLPGTSLDVARAIQELSGEASSPKTLLAVFFAAEQETVRLQQALEPIPCFRFPESAAGALAIAADLAARQIVPELPSLSDDRLVNSEVRAIIDRFLQDCSESGGWLGAAETQRLLSDIDLPVPDWQIADSQERAVHAAEQIGFPVVLKAVHPHLLHKSASGGVVLDVRSSDEVRDAWRVLNARITGLPAVLVQRYLPGEEEVIIGVKYEVGFGHVIGLGIGGTRSERLRDAEFRLLPLTSHDAYDLVRDSPLAEICLAVSGELTPPGKSVYRALLRISTLISAVPEIRELDLNPVAIFPSRDELHVLDSRAFVAGSNKQSLNKEPISLVSQSGKLA